MPDLFASFTRPFPIIILVRHTTCSRQGNPSERRSRIEIGAREVEKRDWVASVHLVVTYPLVVVLGILVQPHFAQPYAVPLEHVHAAAPLVRRTFAEDVAHVRARHDFQGTWKQQLPCEFRSLVRSLQPIPRKRLIAGEKRMGNKFISPQTMVFRI